MHAHCWGDSLTTSILIERMLKGECSWFKYYTMHRYPQKLGYERKCLKPLTLQID
jgi:hypothetical protein